jgi:hypothetical protein
MLFPLLSKTSPCPNACHGVRIVKRTATPIRLIIVFDAPQPWNVAFSYEDYISPSPLTAPDGRGSKKLNGTATFGSGRCRERVPDGKFDYKPHPKSMTLGELATHVAGLPSWTIFTLDTEELNPTPEDRGCHR